MPTPAITTLNAEALRKGFLESITEDASQYAAEQPLLQYLHFPTSHVRALAPDCSLVIGIRGAGKSLWRAALAREDGRALIMQAAPNSGIKAATDVSTGFSDHECLEDYPSPDVIHQLVSDGVEPRHLWFAVVLKHLRCPGLATFTTWKQRCGWVKRCPEEWAAQLDAAEAALKQAGRSLIIVFDALDRTSHTRQDLPVVLRGLLQVALQLRSRTAIRLKVFLRPDMLEHTEVRDFPDYSKLYVARAEIKWSSLDLYGLLWQRLGNAPSSGKMLRAYSRLSWATSTLGRYGVPLALASDGAEQRKLFEAIAGTWMGTTARRGFTFTWLPNHLMDARDQVSPRSFLIALRTAADEATKRTGLLHAIHYDDLKRGVQEASRVRVDEMAEDFPWVRRVLEPLVGAVLIPLSEAELIRCWKTAGVVQGMKAQQDVAREAPPSLREGEVGVIKDLLELGVLSRLPDMRLQMPDVYRVAFKIGRKGGIKPLR